MEVYGDVSSIFNHEGLEELYLDNGKFEINFDRGSKGLILEFLFHGFDFQVQYAFGRSHKTQGIDESAAFIQKGTPGACLSCIYIDAVVGVQGSAVNLRRGWIRYLAKSWRAPS